MNGDEEDEKGEEGAVIGIGVSYLLPIMYDKQLLQY